MISPVEARFTIRLWLSLLSPSHRIFASEFEIADVDADVRDDDDSCGGGIAVVMVMVVRRTNR